MRIVFIITGLGTGGAEVMLFQILKHLDRKRFEPHVISLTTMGDFGPRIAALGIPVKFVGMKPGRFSIIGLYKLVRMLRRLSPEVVHTWMYHADLLGGFAARLAGISKIGWGIHNSNLDPDKTKFSTRIVVKLCALFSNWIPLKILSCSERARQFHVALGYAADKWVVLPNGIDLTRFKADPVARSRTRLEMDLSPDTPLVGMIGRFDQQKNHAGFFEAAGLLHRRMPQVHFVLAGKGIDSGNAELMLNVVRANVVANTHFLGLRDDIPQLMAGMDLLASSSTGEAFPNVLGESMACGVPCAVTDVGDCEYIIGDTGRVVRSGDMVGLATAMQELLELPRDERTALGELARKRVADHFEINAVVRRYEKFYDDLVANVG